MTRKDEVIVGSRSRAIGKCAIGKEDIYRDESYPCGLLWKTKKRGLRDVDKYGESGNLLKLLVATLQDREAYKRSLTTDTMCQNLFDPIWNRA